MINQNPHYYNYALDFFSNWGMFVKNILVYNQQYNFSVKEHRKLINTLTADIIT